MPNLHLDYATQVTQQEIFLAVGLIAGLSLFAFVLFSFTHSWRGVLSGWLILALGLGIGGFFGVYAYRSLDTSHVRPTNITRLQEGATEYGIQLTRKQADTLLTGTDDYVPGNRVSKFGTTVLAVHDRPYPDERQPVSLVWNKTAWQLLIIQADGSYQPVQKAQRG
jgi:hypothetical protein